MCSGDHSFSYVAMSLVEARCNGEEEEEEVSSKRLRDEKDERDGRVLDGHSCVNESEWT